MVNEVSQFITSTTVNILFDDYIIGELQNFSASEDFGVAEVYGVGSPIPNFMPGNYSGNITARKGFIDPNAFFTKFHPFGNKIETNNIPSINSLVNGFANFLRSPNTIGTINDAIVNYAIRNPISSSLVFPADNERKTSMIFFDIKLAYNGMSPSGGVEQKIINIYKDCIITSRKIIVDTTNIIIMEDITIKFRQRI